jgi:hypothetical protein
MVLWINMLIVAAKVYFLLPKIVGLRVVVNISEQQREATAQENCNGCENQRQITAKHTMSGI